MTAGNATIEKDYYVLPDDPDLDAYAKDVPEDDLARIEAAAAPVALLTTRAAFAYDAKLSPEDATALLIVADRLVRSVPGLLEFLWAPAHAPDAEKRAAKAAPAGVDEPAALKAVNER